MTACTTRHVCCPPESFAALAIHACHAGEKNALQEAIVGAVTAGPPELQAQVGSQGLGVVGRRSRRCWAARFESESSWHAPLHLHCGTQNHCSFCVSCLLSCLLSGLYSCLYPAIYPAFYPAFYPCRLWSGCWPLCAQNGPLQPGRRTWPPQKPSSSNTHPSPPTAPAAGRWAAASVLIARLYL